MSDTTEQDRGSAQSQTEDGAPPLSSKKVPLVPTGNEALHVGERSAPHKRPRNPLGAVMDAFAPNRAVSRATMQAIILVELALALLIWLNSPFKILPRPGEVALALKDLWINEGLAQNLWVSFKLNLEALGWSTLISLSLAYLTVVPAFRPLVAAVSKGRFLSIIGFTLVFTLIFGGDRPLKTSLLVFAATVFYVTSMAAVVASIPKGDFDHARTLRMSEWRVVWEVVILGTADRAFEVLRQNAAIGWMMLTMVEGISRAEGGIGVALLNENKHFRLAYVFAIQLVILLIGLLQDYGIGAIRQLVCPYATLTLERK